MRHRFPSALALVATAFALSLVTGCDDDDPAAPEPGMFTVDFDDLPVLPADQYYEAWVSFPVARPAGEGAARRAGAPFHDEFEAVSLGAFTVAADGSLLNLEEGPAEFALAEERNLNLAADVHVTVRAFGDTAHGALIIGGGVTGDDDEGHADLVTDYHDGLDCDLRAASGSCVMATPTDGAGTNETQGIWFTDASGVPVLELPVLGHGWMYAAWTVAGGEARSIGHFAAANAADSDSAGPEAGPLPGFVAPGSDFLASGFDLAAGGVTVLVAAEPDEHAGHERAPALRHEEPFPMTVLALAIEAAFPDHTPMTLELPAGPLPTGRVTFTR
jgi:hypothetical protein